MTKQKIVRRKIKLSKNHKRLLDRYFNKKQLKYRKCYIKKLKGGIVLTTLATSLATATFTACVSYFAPKIINRAISMFDDKTGMDLDDVDNLVNKGLDKGEDFLREQFDIPRDANLGKKIQRLVNAANAGDIAAEMQLALNYPHLTKIMGFAGNSKIGKVLTMGKIVYMIAQKNPKLTYLILSTINPVLIAKIFYKFIYTTTSFLGRISSKIYRFFFPKSRDEKIKDVLKQTKLSDLNQVTIKRYILYTTNLIKKLSDENSPRLVVITGIVQELVKNFIDFDDDIDKLEYIDDFKNNVLLDNELGENCRIALMQLTTISSEKDGKIYDKDFNYSVFLKLLPTLKELVKSVLQEITEKTKLKRYMYENTQNLQEVRNMLTLLLNKGNNKTSNKSYEKNIGKMVNDVLFGETKEK